MSGILNNKQRIIDAIMTMEGRRQLSEGDMRIEFYSFTDTGTRYQADVVSGSADATKRIYFEASHLPQDQITFEADDSGRLKPFQGSLNAFVRDGNIITHSFEPVSSSMVTGTLENTQILRGEEFASSAATLLKGSSENFEKLQLIATKDRLFEDDNFGVSTKDVEFVIHNERPIPNRTNWVSNINHIESLFNDPRLSNVTNFHYLPPVNKIDNDEIDKTDYRETREYHLGQYDPWGRTHLSGLDYQQITTELDFYARQGYCKTIKFDPTSKNNRLLIQVFEKGYSRMKKLDVIDFGKVRTDNPNAPLANIFFVGKVMTDENDTHKFVHIFTLVFE